MCNSLGYMKILELTSSNFVKKIFRTKFNVKTFTTYNRIVRKMEGDILVRSNPIVTKLERSEFEGIFTKNLVDLLEMFKKYNHEVRLAGGPVRDLLMKTIPKDIDLATTATPTEMKEMFTKENVRLINMNGEKHGTITPRINDAENFEVTTLRIDVVTDGRHAEVQFTTDWLLDANRRDLTINSMFMSFDGNIYDYFFGYEDLQKKRVAFVGHADNRIKEDYLRILRYFRFYGRIADQPDKHEPETIQIIKENVEGLQKISGERIWMELKKTLEGNFAGDLVLLMLECGLAKYIGLPENANINEFIKVWKNQSSFETRSIPITLLASLLNTAEDALNLHERLKFSAFERDLAFYITQNREHARKIDTLLPFQEMCLNTIGRTSDMKTYVEELLKYLNKIELYNKLKNWQIPKFPISGNHLKEHGCPGGKAIGIVISELKVIWAKQEFKSTPEDLLKHVPDILKNINEKSKGTKKQKVC